MSERNERVRQSLERCLEHDGFMARFYELLVGSSDEIAAKFSRTDVERQKAVVAESIFLMLVSSGKQDGLAHRRLVRLGLRHSRERLDIRPELYGLWLDSLMAAVAEFDPRHTAELERSWRQELEPGIELLVSLY